MKCIRTVPATEVNPLFSREEKNRVEAAGGVYDSVEIITHPVGQIVDSKQAWMLCAIGKALPEDAECREKLFAHLGGDARKDTTSMILSLREALKSNQLGAADKVMLNRLERAYAVDLGLVPSPLAVPVVAPSVQEESVDE